MPLQKQLLCFLCIAKINFVDNDFNDNDNDFLEEKKAFIKVKIPIKGKNHFKLFEKYTFPSLLWTGHAEYQRISKTLGVSCPLQSCSATHSVKCRLIIVINKIPENIEISFLSIKFIYLFTTPLGFHKVIWLTITLLDHFPRCCCPVTCVCSDERLASWNNRGDFWFTMPIFRLGQPKIVQCVSGLREKCWSCICSSLLLCLANSALSEYHKCHIKTFRQSQNDIRNADVQPDQLLLK